MHLRYLSMVLLVCAVVSLYTQAATLEATESEGPVLLIVDRSGSMKTTDKRNFCIDCVQLSLATVRDGRALNIVGFSNSSRSLLRWRDINNLAERRTVRDQEIGNSLPYMKGKTSYSAALAVAYKELNRISAARGTRIVFFTDGETRDKATAVQLEARRFLQRGWIIDGLNLRTDKPLKRHDLQEICVLTGGNYIEVRQAEDLVGRFSQLANSENDYFSLEIAEITPDTIIDVPPAVQSLMWITAKQENGNGGFKALKREGVEVPIQGAAHYTYPARFDMPSNLQLFNRHRPQAGSYQATYIGQPRAVYVSISLGIIASPIPIRSPVKEYETIQLGLRVAPIDDDAAMLDELAAHSTVTAIIHDEHGNLVSKTVLTAVKKNNALIFSALYSVAWPDNDPKDHTGTHTVDYDFSVDNKWHLHKFDSFQVEPQNQRPTPSIAWDHSTHALPPTWTQLETSALIPFTAGGYLPPSTALQIPSQDGFQFKTPVAVRNGNGQVNGAQVSFRSPQAGHFQTSVSSSIVLEGRSEQGPTTSVSADIYEWKGQSEIALDTADGTSVASWIGTPEGLSEQALQAAEMQLHDAQGGNQGTLSIAADGRITVTIPPSARAGALQGSTNLQYGVLPPRPLRVRYNYTPPHVDLKWQVPDMNHTLPSDAGTWAAVPDQKVIQAAGLPGTLRLEVGDFTGPNGDVLSAAYDIRASVSPENIQAGEQASVKLHVFRGEDIASGVYTGTVKMIHTAENGTEETVVLPMSMNLEASK